MRITISTSTQPVLTLSDGWPWHNQRYGWFILKNGVEGLFSPPAITGDLTARVGQDGSFWPATLVTAHRVITLTCLYSARSTVERAQAEDVINGLFGQRLTLTIHDAHGVRTCEGFISSGTDASLTHYGDRLNFSLIITCPDPNLYGPEITFPVVSGKCKVENDGNTDSWPKIKVTGQCTALSISRGSQKITWRGSTSSLSLDFRTMIPSQGTMSSIDAFTIPPGESTLSVSTTPATAKASVLLKSAWR
jgi:hypothetical protein